MIQINKTHIHTLSFYNVFVSFEQKTKKLEFASLETLRISDIANIHLKHSSS